MTTLREAAEASLDALKEMRQKYGEYACRACDHADVAIIKLCAALAESERDWSLLEATQESLRDHMAEIHRLRGEMAEPVQEPQCNPHPKAPHGYLRNASHTEDRYVCECEYWDPYAAGYQAAMEAVMRQQMDDMK